MWAGSLAQSAEGVKRAMSCLQVTVAVRDHQGRPAPPDAELPGEVVRRHTLYADAEAVDAVQVVGRTDGDPVRLPCQLSFERASTIVRVLSLDRECVTGV